MIKIKSHPNINSAQKRKKNINLSEYKLHCQIAQYLNLVIKKPSRWHTVEVSNHGYGKAAMINQMMDRRKGVITSWPDIEIFFKRPSADCRTNYYWEIIFLEIKAENGILTERQKALHAELRGEGHFVGVVRSVEDVEKILKELEII